ncbi:MAG: Endoribonuclease YbeY [Candidatus Dependentiae bacterium ADurb.Bin331]|nr:MAG: Endoribonuclease YbeY [Candidatus Dependentiae bacterium ADurb.Bin331]
MVTIKNSQRKIKYNPAHLKKDAQSILHFLNYGDFDLGIWLTTNKTIHRYNKEYREKDKPTDILSFAYHPDLKPGKRIIVHEDEDKNLGDLIISLEYVNQVADELGVSLDERMRVLLVHGICHLRGYDHETDSEYKIMHKEEKRILDFLKKS